MSEKQESTPTIVFSGEIFEATYIKSLLEENGIPVFLKNEHMSSIAPWDVSPGGANPMHVVVSSIHYDEAIKLIESTEVAPEETED